MKYAEAIDYLLSFADFERSGRFQDRPDVVPMRTLLKELGDPHLGRVTVHIAGSKGKGSTAAMIESILRAAGHKTGLFTSPHLDDFTERIRIDGEPIAQPAFARLTEELRPAVERGLALVHDRSFVTFDLLTALGFMAFSEAGIHTQVIEVGLGGRVDSTNVFDTKEVAVITPLSYEHTAILGDDIEHIAAEKAAIITPGCTVVLAPQEFTAAKAVVLQRAADVNACVVDSANTYRSNVRSHDLQRQAIEIETPSGNFDVALPLLGRHQAENAVTAVAVAQRLGADDAAIIRGLENVVWPARFEVLREHPLVIADGAHNRESARRLRETLVEYAGSSRVTFVIGSSSDKDVEGVAAELAPIAERVFPARSRSPRAMDPERIAEAFRGAGASVEDVDTVPAALELALAATDESGVICLAGSLFVAAEGREHLKTRNGKPLEAIDGR